MRGNDAEKDPVFPSAAKLERKFKKKRYNRSKKDVKEAMGDEEREKESRVYESSIRANPRRRRVEWRVRLGRREEAKLVFIMGLNGIKRRKKKKKKATRFCCNGEMA